jgi:hypothetical protein
MSEKAEKPQHIFTEKSWRKLVADLLGGDNIKKTRSRAEMMHEVSTNPDLVVMGNPAAFFLPPGLTDEAKDYVSKISLVYSQKYADERAEETRASAEGGSKISKIVSLLDEYHSGGGFYHSAVFFSHNDEDCVFFLTGDDEEYPMKDDTIVIHGVLNYGDESYINLSFENVDALIDWKPSIEDEEKLDYHTDLPYLEVAKSAFLGKISSFLVEVKPLDYWELKE